MFGDKFIHENKFLIDHFVFLELPCLQLGKNELELVKAGDQVGPISLTHLSIGRIGLVELGLLLQMFAHDFIIKLIEFINGLLFTHNHFLKVHVVVAQPHINLLESCPWRLYNGQDKLMKLVCMRPK